MAPLFLPISKAADVQFVDVTTLLGCVVSDTDGDVDLEISNNNQPSVFLAQRWRKPEPVAGIQAGRGRPAAEQPRRHWSPGRGRNRKLGPGG